MLGIGRIEADFQLRREPLQLQDRGGSIHVGAGEQHFLALVLFEPFRQLRRGRRLAGALQSRQQDHDRRLRPQVERPHALAHQRDQLVVDDADQRLARRQALVELLPDDLGAHRLDERLDDRQRDVRFQQRHAHLAQRVAMFSSVSRPRPRRLSMTPCRRSVSLSNMGMRIRRRIADSG